jgi:hypothetical protein
MILLDVLGIEVNDAAMWEGLIANDPLEAVGKLTGDCYCTTRSNLELARPKI